jgi:small GTP-binding protein
MPNLGTLIIDFFLRKIGEPQPSKDEYLLKICIIGNPQEIKTAMVRRFAEGKFIPNHLPTLGVDITTKKIQVDNNTVKLILVDTAGHEFFGKLRPSYYRGASAVIITFDKGDEQSFEAVRAWYMEFRNHIPDSTVPIALVGFLTGPPKISTNLGLKIATDIEAKYYEVDTKNPELAIIEEIFRDLTRRALASKEPNS